jgi:hypothetical protein
MSVTSMFSLRKLPSEARSGRVARYIVAKSAFGAENVARGCRSCAPTEDSVGGTPRAGELKASAATTPIPRATAALMTLDCRASARALAERAVLAVSVRWSPHRWAYHSVGRAYHSMAMRSPVAVVVLSGFLLAGTFNLSPAGARGSEDSLRQVATDLVWASIRGQYGKVWSRLHPRHQRVTSREFWESCQRKRANAVASVEWLSIRVTSTYPDRVRIPGLGRTNVTALTTTARVEVLGTKRTISETNYWVRIGDMWRGLWDQETYAAYAKGRCPPS